jgi:hypothetical protein
MADRRAHAGHGIGPKAGGSYVAKARAAWAPNPPDWVLALAHEADGLLSQRALGEKLGITGGALSAVISKKYPGGYARIEARVKGALMSATVACPVEGEIPRNRCADNQAKKPSAASPARARFPFACRTCPNAFTQKETSDVES